MHKSLIILAVACSSVAHAASETASAGSVPVVSSVAGSTSTPTALALAATVAPAPRTLILPAKAELLMAPDAEISSKTAKLGDKVKLVTAADVVVDGVMVIPKGTPGEGSISFVKGTGSFGKSGRIEVSFNAIDLGGRRIALTGAHRQEGSGNGGATAGAVIAAGLVGGFLVSGHSAVIAKGTVLSAYNLEAQSFTVVAPAADRTSPAGAATVPAK